MALKRRAHTSAVGSKMRNARERVGGRGGVRRSLGVRPAGAAIGADLGGSSKYLSENPKTEVEKGFV